MTKPLSVKLQGKSQDIHQAVDSVQDCVAVLQQFRNDDTFERIFSRASDLFDEEISMPRIVARQRNRCNVSADNAQEYFKRSVFLPFIDTCIGQMTERFQKHAARAYQLSRLLPSFCNDSDFSQVQEAMQLYDQFIPGGLHAAEIEFARWRQHWQRQLAANRPNDILDALLSATKLGTYPIMCIMLRILATVPVTTATGERSFSALKLIKTYSRSTMGEERLNGLAHMYINQDIKLNYDAVIDQFGQKNRRLTFV